MVFFFIELMHIFFFAGGLINMGQWLKQQGGHWIGFFKKMVVVSIFICFLSTYVVIFIDESRFYNIFFPILVIIQW